MLKFSKYHGAGNDFILVDCRTQAFDPRPDRVAALCDRHRGIGADGLMMLKPDDGADFRMRYFNADGGESTLCGNGGRCIALFAHHLGIGGGHLRFTAVDGPHTAEIRSEDNGGAEVALAMSDVAPARRFGEAYFLDTGSPHYVEFVRGVDALDIRTLGARIRHDERFKAGGGTNVNFVEPLGEGRIRVRTFERGVEDETLACGTGAVAAALASVLHTGDLLNSFCVSMPGGGLGVDFRTQAGGRFTEIVLRGPAQKVFDGEIAPGLRLGRR